jgi:hypothetical protein
VRAVTGIVHRFQIQRRLAGYLPAARRVPTSLISTIGSRLTRVARVFSSASTDGGVWTSFGTSFRVTEGASPFFQLQTPSLNFAAARVGVLSARE